MADADLGDDVMCASSGLIAQQRYLTAQWCICGRRYFISGPYTFRNLQCLVNCSSTFPILTMPNNNQTYQNKDTTVAHRCEKLLTTY